MTQPRTAAPSAAYSNLFGEPNPNVATGPCHTDGCTGLHWTDDEAEHHLFTDQTMQAVDPAEWLNRHPEVFLDGSLPVPRNVIAYLNGPAAPGGPLPVQPVRCTADEWFDDDQDPLPTVMVDNLPEVDDPWTGRPVAKGTFRQRWLLGPRFIRRWHVPRTDYYDVVLMIDLRSWMVGFEVWPNKLGGMVRLGPVRITVDEPPF